MGIKNVITIQYMSHMSTSKINNKKSWKKLFKIKKIKS